MSKKIFVLESNLNVLMSDYKEILNVNDYLNDPYVDCTYVRICGGLLRLRKTYTLSNYKRPHPLPKNWKRFQYRILSPLDLNKISNFNINNKKLDLMVSINCRRDGNIIHLQNQIKFLENLSPEEIDRINCIKFAKNCKRKICLAIKEKLFKIINKMNKITSGECYDGCNCGCATFRSDDTEDLKRKLKDPDEILSQLEQFEKKHLKICEEWKNSRNKQDKSIQTDLFVCKCQQKFEINDNFEYLKPGGDYIYHEHCPNEPITLYKNCDYTDYEDEDNFSLNCEALSSGIITENSWNVYMLKYKALIDEYNKRCKLRNYQEILSKKYEKSLKQKFNQNKLKSKYYSYYPSNNNYYPQEPISITTLYFNNENLPTESTDYYSNYDHSDYYSDTSTYSKFYTQNYFRDYYDEEINYSDDYHRENLSRKKFNKNFNVVNGYYLQ